MIVINLYGAPGAGKSTGAAYVFSQLKMRGVNAELVTEFAKDKVWEGSKAVFENQAYIFGEQYFRISRVKDKVDVVVTDSPIMLSCFYGENDPVLGDEFNSLVKKVSNSFISLNAFIDRVKPYNPVGRLHTEEQSDEISRKLQDLLSSFGVRLRHYPGNLKGYDKLVEDIMDMMACTVAGSQEKERKS